MSVGVVLKGGAMGSVCNMNVYVHLVFWGWWFLLRRRWWVGMVAGWGVLLGFIFVREQSCEWRSGVRGRRCGLGLIFDCVCSRCV